MDDQIYFTKSKVHVKRKLLISFVALGLAISSAYLSFDDYWSILIVGFWLSVMIIHLEKIPRYWRANNSKDVEVINDGFSLSYANKQTTLPFNVSGVVIMAIVALYLISAIAGLVPDKILLGLSMLVSLVNNSRKEIMFDYDHRFFYGLWKTPTFYDSDRQTMRKVRFDTFETANNVVKIRVTDKSGYYDIYKKDFSENTWNRVLINIERIDRLNAQPDEI
jgi:hypothetical protein